VDTTGAQLLLTDLSAETGNANFDSLLELLVGMSIE